MKHITCIEDLRQVHMRKVPKAFFDYADRGSYAEETLRANRDGFLKYEVRLRRLTGITTVDQSVKIFGKTWESPIFFSPVGRLFPSSNFCGGPKHAR